MLTEMAIFIFLALVVVASALAMLLSRNAIYAALFLAMNFVTVALLYLILGAPFIALVQVTVYAGSIMVLFLFVIMMLGAERLPGSEPLRGQRTLAILLGCILLAEMGLMFALRSGLLQIQMPPLAFSEPADLGELLFTRYQLLFLVTSVILLAATVGAILLTRGDKVSLRDLLQRKE